MVRRREVVELIEATSEELLLLAAADEPTKPGAVSTLKRRLAWLEKRFGLEQSMPTFENNTRQSFTPNLIEITFEQSFSNLGISSAISIPESPTINSGSFDSFASPRHAQIPFNQSVRSSAFSSAFSSSSFTPSFVPNSTVSHHVNTGTPEDGFTDELAMALDKGGDDEDGGDALSSFRVAVNPTPLLLPFSSNKRQTGGGGVPAARALCNVTAVPALSKSSAATLPVLATAFASGRVEVALACQEVQPVWSGDGSNLMHEEGVHHRGRVPAWRKLFEETIQNVYDVSLCIHTITFFSRIYISDVRTLFF
jgi:hypothetical protein